MSKVVTVNGKKWSVSKWCRRELAESISDATENITLELAGELEKMLADRYGAERSSFYDTVTVKGFQASAEEQLWLDIRCGDWQRVMNWALYFAEFSGTLKGTYYDGVKVATLL